MLPLNALDLGCEVAGTLQLPTDTEVFKVRWAKHHRNMYHADSVVCVKVHCDRPVFHHVVVKDDTLFFVTFALQTVSERAFYCISSFVHKRRTSCCVCQ